MNTDLYSFPYVLVSGGAAGLTLSGCYWLVDIRKIGAPVWKPFMYFGMNAIAMYLLAEGAQIIVRSHAQAGCQFCAQSLH